MSSHVFNVGAKALADRSLDYLNGTIEIILVKSTYTPNLDDTNSVYAAAEISGVSGYTGGFGGAGRKVLASKTITNDTTNDRTVFSAANPSTWAALGTGDTIGGAIVGLKGSASDATAVPLFYLDFTDTPTNGSDFSIAFNASGIAYIQNS